MHRELSTLGMGAFMDVTYMEIKRALLRRVAATRARRHCPASVRMSLQAHVEAMRWKYGNAMSPLHQYSAAQICQARQICLEAASNLMRLHVHMRHRVAVFQVSC